MKSFNKKGFTMVELIVAIALSSFIMLGLVSFTMSMGKVFVESKRENDKQLIMSIVKSYLKEKLTMAKTIETEGDSTLDKLEFKHDSIYLNDIKVLNKSIYDNVKITGSISGFGSVMKIDLNVAYSDGKTKSEIFCVKTLNKHNIDIPEPISAIYFKD